MTFKPIFLIIIALFISHYDVVTKLTLVQRFQMKWNCIFFFSENVFSCGAKVIGKRIGYEGQRSLIVNEGIYTSFGRLLVDDNYRIDKVKALTKSSDKPQDHHVVVDIYGSSGDDIDVIVQDLALDHDVDENEWLFFPNMGAFSFGLSTTVKSCQLPSKFGNFW